MLFVIVCKSPIKYGHVIMLHKTMKNYSSTVQETKEDSPSHFYIL